MRHVSKTQRELGKDGESLSQGSRRLGAREAASFSGHLQDCCQRNRGNHQRSPGLLALDDLLAVSCRQCCRDEAISRRTRPR